jgi:hypothetical protein
LAASLSVLVWQSETFVLEMVGVAVWLFSQAQSNAMMIVAAANIRVCFMAGFFLVHNNNEQTLIMSQQQKNFF